MLRFVLFALWTQVACADEKPSALHGSWRSDAEATNAFLTRHAKLDDFQRKVMSMLFGRSTVTFNRDGTGRIRMEAARIPTKEGGELELGETTAGFSFKILGETDSQIVIETSMGEAFLDEHPFAVLKFHDRDTYSVCLSDSIAEINGREFFKRVKSAGDDKDGTR